MLTFYEYKKTNKIKGFDKAQKMYDMYVKGEEEIMNSAGQLYPPAKTKAVSNISFVSNLTPCWQSLGIAVCNLEEEQEGTTPMNTERDYLNRRISEVYRSLENGLAKQFHLHESTQPKTYKDLIDWIKNDKFEIDKKHAKLIDAYTEEDQVYYGSFLDGIIWTGAGFKNDREGYDAARTVLTKAKEEALEVINTLDAAAGLKALQEFKGWEYVAPKKKH